MGRNFVEHLVELGFNLRLKVGFHGVDIAELGEGPAAVRLEVVHAGDPVGVHRRFLLLGILAAVAGTPPAFIAYEHNKTYGIAEMLGMQDHVLDLNDVDPASTVRLVSRLWDERSRCREGLAQALARIRRQLPEYARLTLAGIREEA